MAGDSSVARIRELPFWQGKVDPVPMAGGLTNFNYMAEDAGKRYVVRLGQDIPEHHVMRFNELAASRAAHAAGLSPRVAYAEPGVMILEFIPSRTLTEADIASPGMLEKIVPLIRSCHRDIPNFLRGPSLIFWVFHVIRDYVATLIDAQSPHVSKLAELLNIADLLDAAAGPFDIVFGHNDLLAANFLDDGKRLWLIDWDYAGFNSPLFDLGGLASNSGLTAAQESRLLELYFAAPVTDDLLRRYHAMKCASLLRETLWSMVSEIRSSIDFDFGLYSAENLRRFRSAYDIFLQH